MTRDEIVNMHAGREMDALIAEKAMGWKRRFTNGCRVEKWWEMPDGVHVVHEDYYLPHFSTDIGDAWELVDKAICDWKWCEIFKTAARWKVNFTGNEIDFAYADTAPLAICRAALLAMCL